MSAKIGVVIFQLMALISLGSCDRVGGVLGTTPSDQFCLEKISPPSESMSRDNLWRHYQHFNLCDYKEEKMMSYLSILVARADPAGLRDMGVLVYRADPVRGRGLIERSAALGYEPAKRTLESLDARPASTPKK